MSDHTDMVLKLVALEREHHRQKWGEQNHTIVEWLAILGEEYGEACKAGVEFHFAIALRTEPYLDELIQTAAVAVAAVENVVYGSA